MKHIITAIIANIVFTGCQTKYVERSSETMSRSVYATDDSIKAGRIDLAEKYSGQTIRLVPPPAERIRIQPLYAPKPTPTPQVVERVKEIEKPIYIDREVIKEVEKPVYIPPVTLPGERILVLPGHLGVLEAVAVDSEKYEELMKLEENFLQIQAEANNWELYAREVDRQIAENYKVQSAMLAELTRTKEHLEARTRALWRNVWISVAAVAFAGLGGYFFNDIRRLWPM